MGKRGSSTWTKFCYPLSVLAWSGIDGKWISKDSNWHSDMGASLTSGGITYCIATLTPIEQVLPS